MDKRLTYVPFALSLLYYMNIPTKEDISIEDFYKFFFEYAALANIAYQDGTLEQSLEIIQKYNIPVDILKYKKIFSNDQLIIFEYNDTNYITLCGTNSIEDIISDSKFIDWEPSPYICRAFESKGIDYSEFRIFYGVNERIDNYIEVINKYITKKKIVFIGHSLGGGLAFGISLYYYLHDYQTFTAAYCSLRPFNHSLGKFYEKHIDYRNIVVCGDAINKLPIVNYFFNKNYYFSSDYKIFTDVKFRRIMLNELLYTSKVVFGHSIENLLENAGKIKDTYTSIEK